jgi:hypothetical protein
MNLQRHARGRLRAAIAPIAAAVAVLASSGAHAAGAASCPLGNGLQHVVYIQFDNLHLERDNPNVPSDLEQMPTLLNFLQGKGRFLTNHHTPLISHTADDILTSLTGLYGDRHGQPVSNAFGYFNATGGINFSSSFAYWTDPTGATSVPIMVTQGGGAAPAPWVPWTRNGCDVAAVSIANIDLENITSDIVKVFGVGSPEWTEANDPAQKAQAAADFMGIALHCGAGSATCANPNARPDLLPDEVGGYADYKALYGHKYVAATLSPGAPLEDIDGNVIQDAGGHIGFPGFGPMTAAISLGYTATMLEAGVPVIYSYIGDAHDGPSGAWGPGEAGYVAKLQAYDAAFARFFARLESEGIDEGNTLFVVTTEEQDHFAGTRNPTPAGCDGVNVPCTYVHTALPLNSGTLGEVNVNLGRLLNTEKNNTTPFSVHSDMAPTYYIVGHPAATDPVTRQLERDVASLTTFNPYTGVTENLVDLIADPAGMKMLHMVTADPTRTPHFVAFQKADYYSFSSGTAPCTQADNIDCVNIQPGFAYNHGGYQPEITTLWLGLVGPGVKTGGTDVLTWTDETDLRPTMLALAGLKDSYVHDGRVITEALSPRALPPSLRGGHGTVYQQLAAAYKQIQAPVGALGLRTLAASTVALKGSDANDATYAGCTAKIETWVAQRDALAAKMEALLDAAAFGGKAVTAGKAAPLIVQATRLIAQAQCN